MTKIALASDLHLEFADINLQNHDDCDILVLAGDIMISADLHDHPKPHVPYAAELLKTLGSRQRKAQSYRNFLDRVSFQFPQVVIVAGNHEFYHGKWNQTIDIMRNECSVYPNVHFLEQDTLTIEDITFVGGTLWTDLNRGDPLTFHGVTNASNDYNTIRHDGLGYVKLRPAHTLGRHRQTLEYFKQVIDQQIDSTVVVVSHMAPSSMSIHEQYRHDRIMNGAYHSDLSEFILDRPQIKLWMHGHVHTDFDYKIGDCRVVCNPRGYVGFERGLQEEEPYFAKTIIV
jgi:Icc-related predicted phosphoesterase